MKITGTFHAYMEINKLWKDTSESDNWTCMHSEVINDEREIERELKSAWCVLLSCS